MRKIWLIARDEYSRHVFNKRFLFGLLSVPLVVLAMIGLIFIIFAINNDTRAMGYVDYSGLLADPVQAPPVEAPERQVVFVAFATEAAAEAALRADEIQAYYVLAPDYLVSGKLSVVHVKQLRETARYQFFSFLSANLLATMDPATANRILEGTEVLVQSPDGSRSLSSSGWFNIVMPFVIAIIFLVAMFTAGGYLMQAVVDEKENRTIEVLMTSVSPDQFMAGKIIGDIAIGLTQLLSWFGFIIISLLLTRDSIKFLQGVQIPPETLVLSLVILVPAFVMVCALMAAIGATVSESREGQQMTGLISLPLWIPYMLVGVILQSPNAPIVVVLSLFPFTAPLTMLIRQAMTIIPTWQVAVSSLILVVCAAGSVWLAGRAFRLGMLRYGKRLKWREIFARQGVKP